jgi:1-phosphatidylinositol-4-phosphate 5-kinase
LLKVGQLVSPARCILPSGDIYEGDIEDDLPCGHGTLTFTSGTVYRGELRAGELSGRGRIDFTFGGYFEGLFSRGERGIGTHVFGPGLWEGDRYEGAWMANEKHGLAKYTYPNGDYFTGRFEHNKKMGDFLYTFANHDTIQLFGCTPLPSQQVIFTDAG